MQTLPPPARSGAAPPSAGAKERRPKLSVSEAVSKPTNQIGPDSIHRRVTARVAHARIGLAGAAHLHSLPSPSCRVCRGNSDSRATGYAYSDCCAAPRCLLLRVGMYIMNKQKKTVALQYRSVASSQLSRLASAQQQHDSAADGRIWVDEQLGYVRAALRTYDVRTQSIMYASYLLKVDRANVAPTVCATPSLSFSFRPDSGVRM